MRELRESVTTMLGGGVCAGTALPVFDPADPELISARLEIQVQLDRVVREMQRSMLGYDLSAS